METPETDPALNKLNELVLGCHDELDRILKELVVQLKKMDLSDTFITPTVYAVLSHGVGRCLFNEWEEGREGSMQEAIDNYHEQENQLFDLIQDEYNEKEDE